MRGMFSMKPPPVMWATPLTTPALNRGEGLDVDLGGGEQHVAELFAAQLVEFGVHGVAGLLEQGLAHQGEAIGVYAGGGAGR